jgi:peptidoglycan/LPS O-acetylase OafA/YrhL
VRKPSKLVETAAMVSFSMFITNEVVRIAWFGVVNVMAAKLALPALVQWGLWGLGVLAAVAFAFAFHFAIDDPIQSRIRRWFRSRAGGRPAARAEAGPVVSLEG